MKNIIEINAHGLHHVGIKTRCLKLSKDFYTSLGFRDVSDEIESISHENRSIFKLNDFIIEIREVKMNRGIGTLDHFAINIANIDLVYHFLKQRHWYHNGEQHQYVFFDNQIHNQPSMGINSSSFFIRGPSAEILNSVNLKLFDLGIYFQFECNSQPIWY